MGINFAVQVLVVRYLSPSDFGALVYGLTVVHVLGDLAMLGMRSGLSRFVPVYLERRDGPRLLGIIVLVFGGALAASALLIAGIHAAMAWSPIGGAGGQVSALLVIVILLVPLEALDAASIELLASFSHARAIFFRRHLLAPGLKLAVVFAVIAAGADVRTLAWSSVAASAAGLAVNLVVLLKVLKGHGVFDWIDPRRIVLPAREVLRFTLPLLTSDLLAGLVHAASIVMIAYFYDTASVGVYRVALPIANLNSAIMASFAVLYLPLAARLYARHDTAALNELYWRTAAWIAALSFPIFAVTFSLARPIIVGVYGASYAYAGLLLQIAAAAFYFNVALGFNSLTLRLVGRTRLVVALDLTTFAGVAALDLLLVPRYGALGAAVGAAAGLIARNIAVQVALAFIPGMSGFDHRRRWLFATIGGMAALLVVTDAASGHSLRIAAILAAACSLIVLGCAAWRLPLEDVLPDRLRSMAASLRSSEARSVSPPIAVEASIDAQPLGW